MLTHVWMHVAIKGPSYFAGRPLPLGRSSFEGLQGYKKASPAHLIAIGSNVLHRQAPRDTRTQRC